MYLATLKVSGKIQFMQTPNDSSPSERGAAALMNNLVVIINGLIMLAIGIVIGYLGRPLVAPESAPEAQTIVITATPDPAAVTATTQPEASTLFPTPTANAASATQAADLMTTVIGQTRHFRGDPNAPVTIVEFADFQCPFCGRFATGAGRQIEETYVQQGQVRMGYQHFAFLGPESLWAAEASECAAEQGKFWEYHDYLFEHQAGENQGAFTRDNLKVFTANLGLDTELFNSCLDTSKYADVVQNETASVQALGVRSTPSFLLNGRPLVGAQPFEVFQQYIDAEIQADR